MSERQDGYENPITGLGTMASRSEYTTFRACPILPDQILTDLYNGDDMAKLIVRIFPEEALRKGYTLDGQNADFLRAEAKRLQLDRRLAAAALWARLYGGAMIWIDNPDPDPAQPLTNASIRGLEVLDKRWISVASSYTDKTKPNCGHPEFFSVRTPEGRTSTIAHESRFVRLRGERIDRLSYINNGCWDYSVLQHCWDALRRFNNIYQSGEAMMTEASQGVLKMVGFMDSLTKVNAPAVRTRALLFDLYRSVLRTIWLDAGSGGPNGTPAESYERSQINFSGVADMLSSAANRLSAASRVPVTKLMGQAPAGLNATGESDLSSFYDEVEDYRSTDLEPPLLRLYRAIGAQQDPNAEEPQITWPALWQMSAKERSATSLTDAQADQIYILQDVLTPEEIALKRFGITRKAPISNPTAAPAPPKPIT